MKTRLESTLDEIARQFGAPEKESTLSCASYRSGDQRLCACGVSADLDDPDPPICPRTKKPLS